MNFGCPVNLASGEIGVGPADGEIFAIFGSGLGPAEPALAAPDSSGQFPASLGNVQVLMNGQAVPLIMAQANEIHGVIPLNSYAAILTIQVRYGEQGAPLLEAPQPDGLVNPGIFSINGQGAILNQDGTVNSPTNPAKVGSIVSVYATGTGSLSARVTDGEVIPIPPPFILLTDQPLVTFAGQPGVTLWAGAAPGLIAGLTQINVQMPATLPAGTKLAAVPVV